MRKRLPCRVHLDTIPSNKPYSRTISLVVQYAQESIFLEGAHTFNKLAIPLVHNLHASIQVSCIDTTLNIIYSVNEYLELRNTTITYCASHFCQLNRINCLDITRILTSLLGKTITSIIILIYTDCATPISK